MEFNEAIAPLLEREGGYVNRKADRGGPTNMGVTQTVFGEWLRSHAMPWRDVKTITRDEAERIYHDLYWKPANCQALPPTVREIHFDAAINHGVRRAAKLLQGAAGAAGDGVIGSGTLAAVNAMHPDLLYMRYIVSRYHFYTDIVLRDRTQREFIVGWLDRMRGFS